MLNFKNNLNRYIFKKKLFFKKKFFFKKKTSIINKKIILDSFSFKNKKEKKQIIHVKNCGFKKYTFILINIYYMYISFLKKFPLKKNNIIFFFKQMLLDCKCFKEIKYINYTEFKQEEEGSDTEKKKSDTKKKKKYIYKMYIFKKIIKTLLRKNISFLIYMRNEIDKEFFFKLIKYNIYFKKNFLKFFINYKIEDKRDIFKFQSLKVLSKISFFHKNKNNSSLNIAKFFNTKGNYIHFTKYFNLNKIFNNFYKNNYFLSNNNIKYYSNQRLVKQPICILNYKLNSNYNINNSTKILKNYVYGKNKRINYHNFLKKFLFNLKKSNYKGFSLDHSHFLFRFIYKTQFKLFM